jgi:hypothetical protein
MQNTTSNKLSNLARLSLGLAACTAVTVAAYAAVTFSPATGIGFVGKGDLQTPWGWNDAKLQGCASGISFYYAASQTASYAAVCVFTTGDGTPGQKTHYVEHNVNKVSAVNSNVTHEARKNHEGKITGFNLTGLESTTTIASGTIPVVGAPCPGNNGHDGVWGSVEQTSSSASGGGLYAVSDDAPAGSSPLLIWTEPTL